MERYTRLYTLPENLYTQGSPVIIAAGALLLDNQTGSVMAQLKFCNVSPRTIKAVIVSVSAYDVTHAAVVGVEKYQYLDFHAERDAEFGQKQAILLPDPTARSFKPRCTRVVFSDDTIWEAPENAIWESMPKPTPLSARLSGELTEQYERDTVEYAAYVPESFMGLWRCTCGALNNNTEGTCHTCRLSLKVQMDALNKETLQEHLTAHKAAEAEKAAKLRAEQEAMEAEKAAKRAEKQQKAKVRRKKTGKIAAITAAAACVCFAAFLLVTKVIIPNKNYNDAVALMDAGHYEEAITAFEAMGGYKDSADQIEACEQARLYEAEVGDYVYFGSYEQDNNTSNGKEDIEWLVLAKEDNKILVISKYALDCQPYNTARKKVTWETCVLRNWLNSDFISAAFTEDEKALILETTVTADKNPSYSTDPGNDTTDKIFLLSIDEANEYFSSDDERMCAPTAYAKAQGTSTSSKIKVDGEASCRWWLRSPGGNRNNAAYVDGDGGVFNYGRPVNRDDLCVRPAFWINLES